MSFYVYKVRLVHIEQQSDVITGLDKTHFIREEKAKGENTV